MKQAKMILLACFCLFCYSSYSQEKRFTDYSIVQTKMGEQLIARILDQGSDSIALQDVRDLTFSIARNKVKMLYPSGKKILMRENGKYTFINYWGQDVRILFTGYGNQFYFDNCFNFLDDFRVGLFWGSHSENTDFQAYNILGLSFRYFVPSKRFRPYISTSYGSNVNRDVLGENSIIRIANLGVGFDLLNRRKMKFDIGLGASGRRRYSQDRTVDRAGNLVEFERDTYAISVYLELGVKFRITSFDW